MKNHALQSRTINASTAKIVRAGESYVAEQGSIYRSGIAAESVGSTMLWLG
ncbi:MAG: cupin, partial [Mesorhizobium sp.]